MDQFRRDRLDGGDFDFDDSGESFEGRSSPGKIGRTTGLKVMRKAAGSGELAPGARAKVEGAAAGSGAALPGPLRGRLEESLDADLSGVRVHTGGESGEAAKSVAAKAYTVGQDIHFGAGQFDPGSTEGERLIAHEVAHTVQQTGGAGEMQTKLEVSTPGDSHEREADRFASAFVSGRSASVSRGTASGDGLHRWFWGDDEGEETEGEESFEGGDVEGEDKTRGKDEDGDDRDLSDDETSSRQSKQGERTWVDAIVGGGLKGLDSLEDFATSIFGDDSSTEGWLAGMLEGAHQGVAEWTEDTLQSLAPDLYKQLTDFVPMSKDSEGKLGRTADHVEGSGRSTPNVRWEVEGEDPKIGTDSIFSEEVGWERREPGLKDALLAAKYSILQAGASLIAPSLEDGIEAYAHFRHGEGRDFTFSMEEYIAEDESGRDTLLQAIQATTQGAVAWDDGLRASDAKAGRAFHIQSSRFSSSASSQNWLKAVGTFSALVEADVKVEEKGEKRRFVVNMLLKGTDFYNFNPGSGDVHSNAPDSENAELTAAGLGDEFISKGEYLHHFEFEASLEPAEQQFIDANRLVTFDENGAPSGATASTMAVVTDVGLSAKDFELGESTTVTFKVNSPSALLLAFEVLQAEGTDAWGYADSLGMFTCEVPEGESEQKTTVSPAASGRLRVVNMGSGQGGVSETFMVRGGDYGEDVDGDGQPDNAPLDVQPPGVFEASVTADDDNGYFNIDFLVSKQPHSGAPGQFTPEVFFRTAKSGTWRRVNKDQYPEDDGDFQLYFEPGEAGLSGEDFPIQFRVVPFYWGVAGKEWISEPAEQTFAVEVDKDGDGLPENAPAGVEAPTLDSADTVAFDDGSMRAELVFAEKPHEGFPGKYALRASFKVDDGEWQADPWGLRKSSFPDMYLHWYHSENDTEPGEHTIRIKAETYYWGVRGPDWESEPVVVTVPEEGKEEEEIEAAPEGATVGADGEAQDKGRGSGEADEEEEQSVSPKAHGSSKADNAGQLVSSARASAGQPLDAGLRGSLESFSGADLGGVSVHTGKTSGEAAGSISAHAYTQDQQIHFGSGNYDPGSSSGQELIAHEVAHTIQQGSGSAGGVQTKLSVSGPSDSHEREADAFASAFASGASSFSIGGSASSGTLHRKATKGGAFAASNAVAADLEQSPDHGKGQGEPVGELVIRAMINTESFSEVIGDEAVGHSWVSFLPDNDEAREQTWGFYPMGAEHPDKAEYLFADKRWISVGIVEHPDGHQGDQMFSRRYPATQEHVDKAIDYAIANKKATYDLLNYHCTEFAIGMIAAAGFEPPAARTLGFSFPNALAQAMQKANRKQGLNQHGRDHSKLPSVDGFILLSYEFLNGDDLDEDAIPEIAKVIKDAFEIVGISFDASALVHVKTSAGNGEAESEYATQDMAQSTIALCWNDAWGPAPDDGELTIRDLMVMGLRKLPTWGQLDEETQKKIEEVADFNLLQTAGVLPDDKQLAVLRRRTQPNEIESVSAAVVSGGLMTTVDFAYAEGGYVSVEYRVKGQDDWQWLESGEAENQNPYMLTKNLAEMALPVGSCTVELRIEADFSDTLVSETSLDIDVPDFGPNQLDSVELSIEGEFVTVNYTLQRPEFDTWFATTIITAAEVSTTIDSELQGEYGGIEASPSDFEIESFSGVEVRVLAGIEFANGLRDSRTLEATGGGEDDWVSVSRKASGSEVAGDAGGRISQASQSSGSALDAGLQGRLESFSGADLSGVSVHTGKTSGEAAGAISAHAYTQDQQIHFGSGNYDPGSSSGQQLIAHEVAHTIQQGSGSAGGVQTKLSVSGPSDSHEREADAFASAFASGASSFSIGGSASSGTLHRKAADEGAEQITEPATDSDLKFLETGAAYQDLETAAFVKGEGDSSAVSPNDVAQGLTGDCWWMASLAAVADADFSIIERAIFDNGDGTYIVTLYSHDFGTPTAKTYTVSEQVPVLTKDIPPEKMEELGLVGKQATEEGDWAFAQPGDRKQGVAEIWPLLLEKAMIQHLLDTNWIRKMLTEEEKGYAVLNVGQMAMGLASLTDEKQEMRSTTGREEFNEARGMQGPATFSWGEISSWWQAGYAITLGTWDAWTLDQNAEHIPKKTSEALKKYYDAGLLITNHAYWVSDVDTSSKQIEVRNPWGMHLDPLVLSWDAFQYAFNTATSVPTGKERVDRKASGSAQDPAASGMVSRASGSSGQSLDSGLQGRLESFSGADLSGVSVHTGAESGAAAGAISAHAYTQNQQIHFAPGTYNPSSEGGQSLIAHEVAHTIQQGSGSAGGLQTKLSVSGPTDSHEREADAFASAFTSGASSFAISGTASSGTLHRSEAAPAEESAVTLELQAPDKIFPRTEVKIRTNLGWARTGTGRNRFEWTISKDGGADDHVFGLRNGMSRTFEEPGHYKITFRSEVQGEMAEASAELNVLSPKSEIDSGLADASPNSALTRQIHLYRMGRQLTRDAETEQKTVPGDRDGVPVGPGLELKTGAGNPAIAANALNYFEAVPHPDAKTVSWRVKTDAEAPEKLGPTLKFVDGVYVASSSAGRPSLFLPVKHAGGYEIECEQIAADGSVVQVDWYIQTVLSSKENQDLEQIRAEQELFEKVRKPIPVKAIYVNEETGEVKDLQFYIGRRAGKETSAGGHRGRQHNARLENLIMFDINPGVADKSWEAKTFAGVVGDFDDRNEYPLGHLSFELGEDNELGIPAQRIDVETDGQTALREWAGYAGWASLAALGGVLVVGTGGAMAPVLLGVLYTATALNTGLSLADNLQKSEIDEAAVAIDCLGLLATLVGAGALVARAGQAAQAARIASGAREVAIGGQTVRMLEYTELAFDATETLLIAPKLVEQLQALYDDETLSNKDKIPRMAAILARGAAQSLMLAAGARATAKANAAPNRKPSDKTTPAGRSSPEVADVAPPAKKLADVDKATETLPPDFQNHLKRAGDPAENELLRVWRKPMGQAAPDMRGLDPWEYAATQTYTGDTYEQVNAALRGQAPMTPEIAQFTDYLQKAMRKLPKEAGTFYRATDLPDVVADSLVEGAVVPFKGFTSTSADNNLKRLGKYRLEVRGKNGVDIGDMSTWDNESEVLFGPGTEFRVLSRESAEDGTVRVVLEELEPKALDGADDIIDDAADLADAGAPAASSAQGDRLRKDLVDEVRASGGTINVKTVSRPGGPFDIDKLAESPPASFALVWGETPEGIVGAVEAAGYGAKIRVGRGGSKAVIIVITGHPKIMQIQYHPGGGSHTGSYYKISTSTMGTPKVIDSRYSMRSNDDLNDLLVKVTN